MALGTGERLGAYEILSPLGKGGMGEVYRARDETLGREVAIKVLPDGVADDEERLRRFQREARVLASLNHPNIAAIHGLEKSGGSSFLVLELVDGETLAERISGRPLPLEDVLELSAAIARALEAAHEQGIVHRDLKPANIKITSSDEVKVLDFGLAKALVEEGAEADSSMSPTITRDATRVGVILGTAAYMSPEQARGKRVDRRTDVFAFGAVLYEMLTGMRAFPGDDVSEILAAVIKSDPDWSALPSSTPRRVRELVQKCLRKDRARRLQHAGDARVELEDARGETPAVGPSPVRPRYGAAIGFLAGLVAGAFGLWMATGSTGPLARGGSELDLRQLTANPRENSVLSGALSPDGKYLAYADLSGVTVRLMETGENHPVELPGELVVDEVDWFPDGTTLLLGTGTSSLWKTSVFGGTARKVADLAYRATVSPTGERIAFLSSEESPARRIYVTGPDGEDRAVLVEAVEGDSFWELAWSPDGEWLLFANWKRGAGNSIEAVRAGTTERKVVLSERRLFQNWRGALPFVWTSNGTLLYGRRERPPNEQSSNLWALSIDADANVRGEPSRVSQMPGVNVRDLSWTSAGGSLSFLAERNQSDVYLMDLHDASGESRRLTMDERNDYPKGWFAGGAAVLISSNRSGLWNVYRHELEPRTMTLLVSDADNGEVSADGSWLLFERGDEWMRAPIAGGPGEPLARGSAIHCSRVVLRCVLGQRDRSTTEYVFSELEPLGGPTRELVRIEDKPPFTNWDLSSDGGRVAVVHNDGVIRIVQLDTGLERQVRHEDWDFGEYVSFASDDASAFVDGSRSGRVITSRKSLLRVSLGEVPRVEELRYRRSDWHVQPEASPDGRYVAFAAMTFSANVWMIHGLDGLVHDSIDAGETLFDLKPLLP